MKLLFWVANNFPLVLAVIMATISFFTHDYEHMRFFLILGLFFVVIRYLAEILAILKKENRKL